LEERGRTILGVELISNVREGDSLYELLIKQPVLWRSGQLWPRKACQRMEVDVVESWPGWPCQHGGDENILDRGGRVIIQGVEELGNNVGHNRNEGGKGNANTSGDGKACYLYRLARLSDSRYGISN
jgi:hypothetical protein